jgi:pimeloyl-ACP methyl ester carboxylesterase
MKRRQFLQTAAMVMGSTSVAFGIEQMNTDHGNAAQSSNLSSKASSFIVEYSGARLYVEQEGTGTPVLLLHGGLGHMGWFSELRSHLAQRYQVVLVDTRGCGRSAMGAKGISYGQQERDVVTILQQLGIRQCPVIGFSDGGIVGMRLAARPDSPVSQLVTIGSRWRAIHGQGMWQEFHSWSRASLSAGTFKFIVEDYDRLNPDQDFDRLLRLSVAMWKDDGKDGHPANRVDNIRMPFLIAVGDRDPFMSVTHCAELRQRVASSQLLVIPNSTHPAYRERPDLFIPALDHFLNQRSR